MGSISRERPNEVDSTLISCFCGNVMLDLHGQVCYAAATMFYESEFGVFSLCLLASDQGVIGEMRPFSE